MKDEREKSKVIKSFEDLIAWQKARVLNREIFQLTSAEVFRKDWDTRNQIRRASVSIMSNIAEGFERQGPAEFHHFLSIAKGSCGEVRSLIYSIFDSGYLLEEKFQEFLGKSVEVSRIIEGLRSSVAKRKSVR